MSLRPVLLPPIVDDDVVAALATLVRRIVAEPRERAVLMQRFDDAVGHTVSELALLNHDSWSSVEEFVTHQLSMPPVVSDIDDDEYVELIARIQAGEASEVALQFWTALLETHLDDDITTLLFASPPLSAREVLRRARR